jgi:HEAT repeat protein
MSFFDFFRGKSKSTNPSNPGPQNKAVARLARVVGDRHAQTYDRLEAIESLAKIGSGEAATALLKRFTYYIEPTTADQEERDAAFRAVLDCGEESIDSILAFCVRAESLSWPLKLLRELLEVESYQDHVIEILNERDTDYDRNIDPKVQLMAALEGCEKEEASVAVSRFLEDVSEPVRFQAISTLVSTNDTERLADLVDFTIEEESVRIRNKIAEAMKLTGWVVPEDKRDALNDAVSNGGYFITIKGTLES